MSDPQIDGELEQALSIPDSLGRLLEVAAIVAARIVPQRLVIVGGLAVSYWTSAQQPTDIDVLTPHSERLSVIMRRLGFSREDGYRGWHFAAKGIEFEAPASAPQAFEQVIEVGTPLGRVVEVLSPADLAVWRTKEFVGTGDSEAALHVLGLWESKYFDLNQFRRHLGGLGKASSFVESLELCVNRWRTDGLPASDALHQQADALIPSWYGSDGDMGTVRSRS